MIATRIVAVLGALFLALLCWLAIRGFGPATELLVTFAVLFAMIAGGSWLTGKMGIYGRGRRPAAATGRGAPGGRPAAPARPAGSMAEAERYCPGAELAGRRQEGGPAAGAPAGRPEGGGGA